MNFAIWLLLLSTPHPTAQAGSESHERAAAAVHEWEADRPLAHDDPALAQTHYWMKRAVTDGGPRDLHRRYRAAKSRAARMPRFSTRTGRFLDSGERGGKPPGVRAALGIGEWEPLGPGNIGGRTRALLIDPSDPRILYAAGVSGGVWKSTDGGGSWVPLADMLPNIAVSTLAMDPKNSRVLYAGTGEGHFRELVRGTGLPLRGAGVFKSVDAGLTWRRLDGTAGEDFQWVNRLRVSPLDSNRIYAAARSGVWRSNDGGDTWRRVLETSVLGGCFDLAVRGDTGTDWMLASCGTFQQATVYQNSAAEGESPWRTALSEFGMGLTSLAFAPSNPDRVYALSASHVGGPGGRFNGGLHAVFASDEGGVPGSWTARLRNDTTDKLSSLLLTNPLVASQVACGIGSSDAYSTLGWYTNMIAVDPLDPDIVWAGGVDLFRSDDGGSSWGPVSFWWNSPPSAHADQHSLVFHPDYDGESNQTFFLGNDGGVWRTDNARAAKAAGPTAACDSANSAVRWTSLNRGYGVTQFYHGVPFPDGRSFLGGTQDNGTLLGSDAEGGDGWRMTLGGDGGYVAVNPDNPNVVYAEAQLLNLHKSTDGGMNFVRSVNGLTERNQDVLFITPFILDPSDSERLWTGGRRPWTSDDGAANWRVAGGAFASGGKVSAIAVFPGDSRLVLMGLDNGFIHRQDNALETGPRAVWPSSQPRSGFVSWLAFDPLDLQVAYATYAGFGGQHVWKSVDGGMNWASIDGQGDTGLPDIPVHCLVVDPSDRDRIYLGTDLGVFVSVDGGINWAVENTGFANVVTESLALNRPPVGPAHLFAFTHGRGVWRVPLGSAPPDCTPDRWIVHVTPADSSFETKILASNFGPMEDTLTLLPYDASGNPLPPASLTVPAASSTARLAADLFPGAQVSHFGICGPSSTAVGAAYRINSILGITAHVLETAVADREFFAYTGDAGLVFDGAAWIHLGDAPARVDAILLDEDGGELQRVTLGEAVPPKAKLLAVLGAEFDGAEGAAVRVESDQPGALLLLRGTIPPAEPMLLFETPSVPIGPRR